MEENCIFCNRNELAQKAVIEEGENFELILDPFPVSNGHILIVPNQHVEKIEKLDTETGEQIQDKIIEAKKLAKDTEKIKEKYFEILKAEDFENSEEKIKQVIGNKKEPKAFNIGYNQGKTAGQTINHLHIHVIPRYEEDVENPEGGIRNVIPEKGNYTE
jgi:diadenosine tetraphosphate (Ap4A) HIT family hydrolase